MRSLTQMLKSNGKFNHFIWNNGIYYGNISLLGFFCNFNSLGI